MSKTPQIREIYAVNIGELTGAHLAYIKTEFGKHWFLAMPDMVCIDIPLDVWDNGLTKQFVEFVEEMPEEIYNVCQAQYYKNELSSNRRE